MAYTPYPETEEIKKSKYNTGLDKIYRLNKLWSDANLHSRTGQYSKWNEDLDRIWCELAGDLKYDKDKKEDKEYENYKKEFDEFDNTLAQLGGFDDAIQTKGFNKITNEHISKRNNQYKKLMEKELFLRRLENSLGKGTAWEDEDEDFE
jgi:hypothetical protein